MTFKKLMKKLYKLHKEGHKEGKEVNFYRESRQFEGEFTISLDGTIYCIDKSHVNLNILDFLSDDWEIVTR